MQSSAELKRQAKESLKGRWGQAVLLNLIPTLIGIATILLIMIPIILFATTIYDGSASVSDATTSGGGSSGGGGGIISSIISALFMSGISWTYLDILRGQRSDRTIQRCISWIRRFVYRRSDRLSCADLDLYNIMGFAISYSWNH